jgi:mono/diheme cytochrome c family protein
MAKLGRGLAVLATLCALGAAGAALAAIGNCAGCHTAREGADFAGGVELATPCGVIHGTNITQWSQDA